MIGKTISHYKILEKIGEGGMGVVLTPLDKSVTTFVLSTIQTQAKLFWRINQVCYPTGSPCEIEIERLL